MNDRKHPFESTGDAAFDAILGGGIPARSVVIVAGDVKAEEVFRVVEQNYGSWQRRAVPERARDEVTTERGDRRRDREDVEVLLGA